ncbi:hypothetical protein MKZ38_006561 [Zalerion maritima]|uniref:Uncharacterized protein n=1 Tax=Zalerion maritima TaxID=339359 RepID=A0AAD5RYV9_9PEZI|nr:hypothetical protein MKZ38_006561 [Zalerion maritima]
MGAVAENSEQVATHPEGSEKCLERRGDTNGMIESRLDRLREALDTCILEGLRDTLLNVSSSKAFQQRGIDESQQRVLKAVRSQTSVFQTTIREASRNLTKTVQRVVRDQTEALEVCNES